MGALTVTIATAGLLCADALAVADAKCRDAQAQLLDRRSRGSGAFRSRLDEQNHQNWKRSRIGGSD